MSSKTPPKTASPPRAHVKKENEEEIKEFAETAMNELLGWYGYERLELRRWAASRARDGSSPEGLQSADHKSKDECSWCNKSMSGEGALQQAGASFCSELCFSQSRRANFKRAKTCDWCRHVRHTVAYVDFQDGATQLQFCSDKCLNQYKMHIFCRETQAHLDLNPHLVSAASSSNLITPELWLKNCKSRSASPISERSASPTADSVPIKPTTETERAQRKSPQPLITIAPTAKLMKPKRPSEETATVQRSPESKKEMKTSKMNLRKRRTSKCSATVTSQSARQPATPKAQDLRMCSPIEGSPPAASVAHTATHSPPHPMPPPLPPPTFPNSMFGMPPPVFMDNGHGPANDYRLPNMYHPRLNFMPRPSISMHQNMPRLPPPMSFPSQTLGQAPPVTVLVPYPVILPIPVPIPVPIPLTSFLQAHLSNKVVKTEAKSDDVEGPLDFTMNGKKDEPAEVNSEGISETSEVKESSAEENIVNERIEDKTESDTHETANPEQTLPKFKITRIGNKMAKIVPKNKEQSESMRPLRKRRRLVESVAEDDPLIPKRKTVQV